MSKQVLDILQMQHLKELGVDMSNASCYTWYAEGKEYPYWGKCKDSNGTPVFTLQDILDLLPNKIEDELILFIEKGKHKWNIGYTDIISEEIFEDFSDKIFIDAAYKMLCWCIENGFLETK